MNLCKVWNNDWWGSYLSLCCQSPNQQITRIYGAALTIVEDLKNYSICSLKRFQFSFQSSTRFLKKTHPLTASAVIIISSSGFLIIFIHISLHFTSRLCQRVAVGDIIVMSLLIYITRIDRRTRASSASDNGWSNPYHCILSPTQLLCSWHRCLLNPKSLPPSPPPYMCLQFPSGGLWFNSGIISIRLKAWSIARETKVGDKTALSTPLLEARAWVCLAELDVRLALWDVGV